MLNKLRQKHKKNEHVRSSYAYVAVFTKENRGDISTSTRQLTVLSAILLNIEGSLSREICQEMVFCECVFSSA